LDDFQILLMFLQKTGIYIFHFIPRPLIQFKKFVCKNIMKGKRQEGEKRRKKGEKIYISHLEQGTYFGEKV